MTNLFDAIQVGEYALPNRIMMAPMTRSRADDAGVPKADLVPTYYAQRASAGLIISEGTYPSAMGKGYIRTPGIHTPEQIEGWRKVTDAVHAAGGRIFCQIMHCGRIAHSYFLPNQATPVAPSAVQAAGQTYTDAGMKAYEMPRALETEEIPHVIEEYRYATICAQQAGFDGVELHAASGYLPEQFLSSKTNLRTDSYGGSVENRLRFVLETLGVMIGVMGSGRVGIKISPEMGFNDIADANPVETYSSLVTAINPLQLSYLHVAPYGKTTNYHELLRPLFKGTYFAGGGFTQETGSDFLKNNQADAIVYGSLFIANPDLPKRFELNAPLNTPDRGTFYSPSARGYLDYPAFAG